MEPWQSWAVVLIFGILAYYYYSTQSDSRGRAQRIPGRPTVRHDNKAKRKGDTDATESLGVAEFVSSDGGNGDAAKRKKPVKKSTLQAKPLPVPAISQRTTPSAAEQEEQEDKEWAAQLASLKKGSSLTVPINTEKKFKTVRQSGAELSGTSSTTGADADDDLSPTVSPSLGATSNTMPSGRDVFDMLEPAAPGPSVLRLTESSNLKPSKPSRQQVPATQQVESKKQRQNRKKVEEQKAIREEQERERRALMEKQRRAAREARGEPAKDGSLSASAPTSNAWAAKPVTSVPTAVSVGPTDGLLDTFDSPNESQIAPATMRKRTTGASWGDLPSEEEQMRMAMEDSGWNTVPKGRKGKKKPGVITGDTTGNESSDTGAPLVDPIKEERKSAAPQTVNEPPKLNGGSIYDHIAHPDDSEWAVV